MTKIVLSAKMRDKHDFLRPDDVSKSPIYRQIPLPQNPGESGENLKKRETEKPCFDLIKGEVLTIAIQRVRRLTAKEIVVRRITAGVNNTLKSVWGKLLINTLRGQLTYLELKREGDI